MTSILVPTSRMEAIWNANLAKACSTLAGMTWNFLAYRYIVFRGGPESATDG